MLPDIIVTTIVHTTFWVSQCTYRCAVLPDTIKNLDTQIRVLSLNAPTGAWCSLTTEGHESVESPASVSMHLQVRGAP